MCTFKLFYFLQYLHAALIWRKFPEIPSFGLLGLLSHRVSAIWGECKVALVCFHHIQTCCFCLYVCYLLMRYGCCCGLHWVYCFITWLTLLQLLFVHPGWPAMTLSRRRECRQLSKYCTIDAGHSEKTLLQICFTWLLNAMTSSHDISALLPKMALWIACHISECLPTTLSSCLSPLFCLPANSREAQRPRWWWG